MKAVLVLLLLAIATPAWAEDCWEDVTPAACPRGTNQILKFKNSCAASQKIMVCLKWTSGAEKDAVKRYTASAAKGALAEINVAACNSGQFNYTYSEDGSEPSCPQ
jgi:hypothetical protein